MVSVYVDVDASDVLDELSDKQLLEELDRRAKKKGYDGFSVPETWVHAIIREALEERDWCRIEELASAEGIFWFRPRNVRRAA